MTETHLEDLTCPADRRALCEKLIFYIFGSQLNKDRAVKMAVRKANLPSIAAVCSLPQKKEEKTLRAPSPVGFSHGSTIELVQFHQLVRDKARKSPLGSVLATCKVKVNCAL